MKDLWNTPLLRKDYLKIQEVIAEAVEDSNKVIREPLRDLVAARGKMLRPMFVVLAAKFGKGGSKKVYSVAAAIELLHLATLIHDDVIDDSPIRRGRPTIHTKVGKKQAILIGDYLFSQCFSLVAQYATIANSKLLARAVSHICSSEISQAEDSFSFATSVRRYNRRIAGKTAALFTLSCYIGASEAGCKKTLCNRMSRIGYNLGMGFQIIDDILDYTGSKSELGKPVGSDLKEGIATLPLIYALRNDDGTLKNTLTERPVSEQEIGRIISSVADRGGIRSAEEAAATYTHRALAEIDQLPPGQNTDFLSETVSRLLHRTA